MSCGEFLQFIKNYLCYYFLFRMMPYACLATGKEVGMIEVVRNAKTVMNIQRKGGRMAAFQVDSTQLHKYIKEKNKGAR